MSTLANKMKIKADYVLLTVNAPSTFKKCLPDLPGGVRISDSEKKYHQVHWFVMDKAQLEKDLSKVMKLMKPEVTVWVYFPKETSTLQTDLTRDKGWDCLQTTNEQLCWINLISFDETWSVFGIRYQTEADKIKAQKPKPAREIFDWIDPAEKKVTLPADLAVPLKKNKQAQKKFDALSFTNKKEYLEWVLTAKRADTRNKRILATIERLSQGWNNPANR